jgi:hypothetical protein
MSILHGFQLAAVAAVILLHSPDAGAQKMAPHHEQAATTSEHKDASGIVLDHLTARQLRVWESIVKVVLARDSDGHALHPMLYSLYHHAQASDHEIRIELSTRRTVLSAVGFCRIQPHTGVSLKEVVLIRLNLGMIDRAIASETSRRNDGFIPFAGLSKKERYAEVLGHELAHVIRLISNAEYRGLYLERQALADARNEDVQVIDGLTRLIEAPAEEAEIEIWRELTAGRGSMRQTQNTRTDKGIILPVRAAGYPKLCR